MVHLDFTCNVCGYKTVGCAVETMDRETPTCAHCGSSVRWRCIVHLLSVVLFGRSIPLPEFPVDHSIVGIGLSDWIGYAKPLAEKFDYVNTFFHQAPLLDITAPIGDRAASCNFVIATEVFEHVCPPVSRAFTGAFDLLKRGGHLVLTVPSSNKPNTIEHFPELHDYRIVQFGDRYVLVNRTKSGRFELHENPIFHGGDGTTLEMRLFSHTDLVRQLAAAGFKEIQVANQDVPRWGILLKVPWSLPILARRPL